MDFLTNYNFVTKKQQSAEFVLQFLSKIIKFVPNFYVGNFKVHIKRFTVNFYIFHKG